MGENSFQDQNTHLSLLNSNIVIYNNKIQKYTLIKYNSDSNLPVLVLYTKSPYSVFGKSFIKHNAVTSPQVCAITTNKDPVRLDTDFDND